MFNPALTIRIANAGDSRALQWLAWLSRRPRFAAGPALVAECDGVPVAAIALSSGKVLADPFNATRDTVRALRLTRYRILRQGGQTDAARSLLRRGTPATLVPATQH